jgi:predicted transcriptional regulator
MDQTNTERRTVMLLERVRKVIRESTGNDSDYLLAENLGVRRQTVAKWYKGQTPETYIGIRIARILNEPELKVIALLELDRAKDEVQKDIWTDLLKKVLGKQRRISDFASAT